MCWVMCHFKLLILRGSLLFSQDAAYVGAGAKLVTSASALSADVILKVRPPSLAEVSAMKEGVRWVSPLLDMQ